MKPGFAQTYLKKTVALPGEHGSWVFILSPLLIGLFAGGRWSAASAYLVITAMAAFLIRQPVTILVKVYSGRRSRRDLPSAWFWTFLYGVIAASALVGLILSGFSYILILAVPGLPVFLWHLWLISRREERRQIGIEIVGSGVLALAAPAAYWIGIGIPHPMGWWLFVLNWLQSAASIVHAYMRLEQRELLRLPELKTRFQMARRALMYTTFNVFLALTTSFSGLLPSLVFLPFSLQWLETAWGALRPAMGVRPTRIGLRQLIVSTLFTLLFIFAWISG